METRKGERGKAAHLRRHAGCLPAQLSPAEVTPRLLTLEHAQPRLGRGLSESTAGSLISLEPGHAWARRQPKRGATVRQGRPWRTVIPYLFLPFPEVDGGRLNTILAIPSSMARKYARRRVSTGHESSNTALSANS